MKNTHTLAWHHFKFRVPADWESTAYSVEDRAGRLEFSTRKGFQALVGWEPCKRAPDAETMMLSFLREQTSGIGSVKETPAGGLKTRTVGAFLMGLDTEDRPCQAIGYLESRKKLLSWVFASSGRKLVEETFVPLLESFEPNDGAVREYALHGLRFRLPETFALEDMTVLPANVMMTFESVNKARVTFRRWGMTELVLKGKALEAFYPAFLGIQGCRVGEIERSTVFGMEAVRVGYAQRGQHQMDRLAGRMWKNGEAWLWYDTGEMRLYAFERIGPRAAALPKMEEVFPHFDRQS